MRERKKEKGKEKRLEGKLDNVIKFGKCMLVQNVKKKNILKSYISCYRVLDE